MVKLAKSGYESHILHEAYLLTQIDHPNVITCLDYASNEPVYMNGFVCNFTYIVLPYLVSGSLFDLTKTCAQGKGFSEEAVKFMFK